MSKYSLPIPYFSKYYEISLLMFTYELWTLLKLQLHFCCYRFTFKNAFQNSEIETIQYRNLKFTFLLNLWMSMPYIYSLLTRLGPFLFVLLRVWPFIFSRFSNKIVLVYEKKGYYQTLYLISFTISHIKMNEIFTKNVWTNYPKATQLTIPWKMFISYVGF